MIDFNSCLLDQRYSAFLVGRTADFVKILRQTYCTRKIKKNFFIKKKISLLYLTEKQVIKVGEKKHAAIFGICLSPASQSISEWKLDSVSLESLLTFDLLLSKINERLNGSFA